jgi:hypothetical protein
MSRGDPGRTPFHRRDAEDAKINIKHNKKSHRKGAKDAKTVSVKSFLATPLITYCPR